MEAIRVGKGFISFRLWIKLSLSLVISMLASSYFVSIGIQSKDTDGLSVDFLFSSFLIWTLVMMLLCGAHIVYDFFWQRSFVYSVTGEQIRMKGGIINTIERATDIKRVTDVSVYQSMWGKIFKYATVGFQTAGSNMTEVVFKNIPSEQANQVRDFVYVQLGKKTTV
jgi:uncharacterized membrane protein YdbT with pleckstrin-like domain